MRSVRLTICAIAAALAFGLSAEAKPRHSWKYTPQRCGFELSYENKGVEKRIEYDMRQQEAELWLNAPDKDKLIITAKARKKAQGIEYDVTKIYNKTSLDTCFAEKDSPAQCSKRHLTLAGNIMKNHLEGIDQYKRRWRTDDSGRCDILGGWY